jgi:hypothetical protein
MRIFFNRGFLLLTVFCFFGLMPIANAASGSSGQTLSVTVDNSIYEIPETPTIIRSENITTNSLDLVVEVGSACANTSLDFVVTIRNTVTGISTTQSYDQTVNAISRTTLPVGGLIPGTVYEFRVQYSLDGQNVYSADSAVHIATTLIDPPVLDSISNVTKSEATLNVVVNPAFVGSSMDFIVEVKNELTGDTYTVQMMRDVTSSSVALNISDLDPGTEYTFRVRYGREGTGDLSGYSNERSEITDLDAPAIDDINNITMTSMDLVVKVDGAFSGETMDFVVEVTNGSTGQKHEVNYTAKVGGGNTVTLTIDDLDPNTEYSFRVKYAWENSDNYSGLSGSKSERTTAEEDTTKVEVCHDGNTITIAQISLADHLAHGDTEGPCPVVVPPGGGDIITPGGIIDDVQDIIEGIVSGGSVPATELKKEKLREVIVPEERKSVFQATATVGATAGTIAVLAGSAVPLFTAMPGAFSSSIFLKFVELFGIIGRRKEERNWGVVFDSVTRMPIPATKILLTDETGKELATTYSDKDGRFGFLASPGKYFMHIFKKDYELIKDITEDDLYGHVYNGGEFEIGGDNIILYNIAMKSLVINWEEYSKKKVRQYKSTLSLVKKYFFMAVYVFGAGATVVIAYFYPTTFNLVMLGIYILLFIYQIFFKKKKYGMIETAGGTPVPFAVVSLHDKDSNEKQRFAVTDSIGRYYLLADNGQYNMKAKGQPVSGVKFEKQGDIHVNDGIVRKDIIV